MPDPIKYVAPPIKGLAAGETGLQHGPGTLTHGRAAISKNHKKTPARRSVLRQFAPGSPRDNTAVPLSDLTFFKSAVLVSVRLKLGTEVMNDAHG